MKVISLFAGAGGLDLGFSLAGHEIVWVNDFDEDSLKTYEKNFKSFNEHKIVLGDIVEYLNQDEKILKNEIPDADIVIGGFPCQGFSIANINRNMKDERNYLYLQVLKMIKLKQPKFILLENVKGLENIEKGKVLSMIINDIENTGKGYTVFYNVINALNYGVPQNRERIIIFGVRNDYAKKIKLPIFNDINSPLFNDIISTKQKKILNIPTTHSEISKEKQNISSINIISEMFEKKLNKKNYSIGDYFDLKKKYTYQTLRDTIYDLPEETDNPQSGILNHTSSKCKLVDKNSIKIKMVGNRPTLRDKHAPTIMGRGSGTGGPLIIPHPEYNRRMSVREVARIQTFPNSFEFIGSNSSCYRQIGNAVPVLMAYHIGKIFPSNLDDFLK